jgi:hypothetical protein
LFHRESTSGLGKGLQFANRLADLFLLELFGDGRRRYRKKNGNNEQYKANLEQSKTRGSTEVSAMPGARSSAIDPGITDPRQSPDEQAVVGWRSRDHIPNGPKNTVGRLYVRGVGSVHGISGR